MSRTYYGSRPRKWFIWIFGKLSQIESTYEAEAVDNDREEISNDKEAVDNEVEV